MDFYLDPENCYQRLEDEFKKYGKLIFCVDFDDTLYDFHNVGRTYTDVMALLKEWEDYRTRVSQWEIEEYLAKF